ncbi:hypothetical protein [uncultured Sphingomonas sp.]|uniref:hypothetical protein n=1 Tax=uncultured Sphingomonas sp. TaxID=158754 RepID=UPI0025EB8148|nr:hypothetical protein [uncultured Sphingomonas sp.]
MKKTLPALAALALLAACSSNDEPSAPVEANGTEMLDVTNEAVNVEEAPVTMNVPEAPATNMADEPEPTVDEREQIQADADATGMTARVNRDEEPAPAANQSGVVSEEK